MSTAEQTSQLTHIDAAGTASMVDVSDKAATTRVARAEGFVRMKPETMRLIETGTAAKGDVIATARIAGIMAAKRTADLVPLCHPLPLTHVALDFETLGADAYLAIARWIKEGGEPIEPPSPVEARFTVEIVRADGTRTDVPLVGPLVWPRLFVFLDQFRGSMRPRTAR